jgi:hypothetical protein
LEDRVLQHKLEAAAEYIELKDEVDRAIAIKGAEYFRIECLKRITKPLSQSQRHCCPLYEEVGRQRVLDGKYSTEIRYQEHVLPILDALRNNTFAFAEPRVAQWNLSDLHGLERLSSYDRPRPNPYRVVEAVQKRSPKDT